MEKAFILVPLIIGGFLIGLVYTAYFFVLPPFYSLHSVEYSISTSFPLDSAEEEDIWILPGPRDTAYPKVCLTEDVTFDLNISLLSDNDQPLEVRVYPVGNRQFSEVGNNISRVLSQPLPSNFPRFPGLWLSRSEPPRDGLVLVMTIENLGQESTTVSVDYSVVGYYRLGTLANFVIVVIGILFIGFTVFITLLHSITILARKIVD